MLERVLDEARRQLRDEVIDERMAAARTEKEIVGPGGLMAQLSKQMAEQGLEVAVTDHVRCEPRGRTETRAPAAPQTLVIEDGPIVAAAGA